MGRGFIIRKKKKSCRVLDINYRIVSEILECFITISKINACPPKRLSQSRDGRVGLTLGWIPSMGTSSMPHSFRPLVNMARKTGDDEASTTL